MKSLAILETVSGLSRSILPMRNFLERKFLAARRRGATVKGCSLSPNASHRSATPKGKHAANPHLQRRSETAGRSSSRCARLVFNLWWTWEPTARGAFPRRSTRSSGTGRITTRCGMLQLCRQARLEEVAEDDDFLREMKAVLREVRRLHGAQGTYGKTRTEAPLMSGPGGVFLGGVRLSRVVAELLGRPGHSLGRSLQVGERSRRAVRRVHAALPARLFPQQINKEGWQESLGAEPEFLAPAAAADALDKDGAPLCRRGEDPRTAGCG